MAAHCAGVSLRCMDHSLPLPDAMFADSNDRLAVAPWEIPDRVETWRTQRSVNRHGQPEVRASLRGGVAATCVVLQAWRGARPDRSFVHATPGSNLITVGGSGRLVAGIVLCGLALVAGGSLFGAAAARTPIRSPHRIVAEDRAAVSFWSTQVAADSQLLATSDSGGRSGSQSPSSLRTDSRRRSAVHRIRH